MDKREMDKICSWKLSWVTFIANVVILFHHANLKTYYPEKVTSASSNIMDFFSVISIPAMVWFFFISAYLFFRNLKLGMIPGKWRRRIKSILIPFIIWNTVSVILELAKGSNVIDGGILNFVVKNYLFIRGTGCANGPLWYLFRLMEYIVIAPLVFFIAKNKWLAAGAEILLLAANYQLGIGYFDFSYWLPVYIVGAYVGINMPGIAENVLLGEDIQNKPSRVTGFVTGIIIIIGFSYAVYALPEPFKSIVRYLSVVGIFLLARSMKFIKPPHIVIGGGYVALLYPRYSV